MVEAFRTPLATDANRDSVAIVTGGGTGIGRATARELVRTGARVAICGRRSEPLIQTAQELGSDSCLAMACDVREPGQVDAFLDAVQERFGGARILINNAGGQFAASIEGTSLKGLRAVHRLNVDAVWDITQKAAARWMVPARSGVVITLGFSPRRGIPQAIHSSMARSALETFAAGIAQEWSRFGIRGICVAPGLVRTEGAMQYGGEQALGEFSSYVPLRRAGTPEEVAALICFLVSPGATYITGTTVLIDGGADAWGHGFAPPALES
jgi:citronellol/citronellal dehydrogenase